MKRWLHASGLVVLSVVVVTSTPAASVADTVDLTMQDGRVTLRANGATLQQILAEWARVGQTHIENLDSVSGLPLMLELRDVSEAEAIAVLLRTVSGYMVAPRAEAMAGASTFDRILILASSTAPTGGAVAASAPPMPGYGGGGPSGYPPATPTMPPVEQVDSGAQPTNEASAPETSFDYANPQSFRAFQGGGTTPPAAAPSVPTFQPSSGTSAPRPGMVVAPPEPPAPTFRNPYGLPDNVIPGSVQAPPQEPDRAKYANPGYPGTP